MTIRREYRIAALRPRTGTSCSPDASRTSSTFLTRARLRVIVAARKRTVARGGVLVLANPQPQVGALPGLNVFESVKELDEYLATIQRKVIEGQA